MLDDPRGVLVMCPHYSDAEKLDEIIRAHGIDDWVGDLMERFDSCSEQWPDEEVCFDICDRRIVQNPGKYFSSVGYCFLSYFDGKSEFADRIRCTFSDVEDGTEIPDDCFEGILCGGGEP